MSIRRNTFYNFFGSFLPLLVSLLITPIYIGLIGEERYGLLAIVWLLLGYFNLFDLGLGRATAQHIAASQDVSDKEIAQVFWTALTINLALGMVSGLLVWPLALYFFDDLFKVDESIRPEIYDAVPWLAIAAPVSIFSSTLMGALQGRERFFELNFVLVTGTLIFQILPLLVAKYLSINLAILLPAVLFSRFLTLLALFERCKKHIIRNNSLSFSWLKAGQLLRFGGWVTVTSFVSPMMVILDRFVIGSLLGAKSVTYYTVPFQLAERSLLIPGSLTTALFPRFSAVSSNQEKMLASEAMNVLIVVMTPIIVTGVLLMNPFLTWWMGVEFAQKSSIVGQVTLVGFWVNGFARVPYAQLQARGKPGQVAKCHLLEVLPYFLMLYLGLHYFGLVGAAFAFTFRVFIDFILLSRLAGNISGMFRLFFFPVILLIGSFLLNYQTFFSNRSIYIIMSIYLFMTMVWAWIKAPDSIRNQVLLRIKPYFKKPI